MLQKHIQVCLAVQRDVEAVLDWVSTAVELLCHMCTERTWRSAMAAVQSMLDMIPQSPPWLQGVRVDAWREERFWHDLEQDSYLQPSVAALLLFGVSARVACFFNCILVLPVCVCLRFLVFASRV